LGQPPRLLSLCGELDYYNRWYPAFKLRMARVADQQEANLISSRLTNGRHAPILDLDYAARLVPSRTKGHYHLYLDGIQLPWWKYRVVLRILAWAGIVEKGWVKSAIAHKGSQVRLRKLLDGIYS
jgi:hypothetical protein